MPPDRPGGAALRVAVMGSGGVGGYFGARLAQGGCDVSFIARGAHLAALRASGLRVQSARGDVALQPVVATDDPREIGPVDVVLFGVKLWDTESAAERLAPLLGPDSAVLSLQNGVSKDEVLQRVVGARAVLGGVCYIAASIAEPGLIRHGGMMAKLVFGEHEAAASARTTALLAACRDAGIDAELSADIRRAIWEKFVFLVGFSGTTAAVGSAIGPIRSHPRTRAMLLDAMRETVAVARAEGVSLDADYAEQRLAFCDTLPAEMSSSMHHDLQRGGRLELDWLGGEVLRRGRRAGIATPVNQALFDILALHADGRAAA